MVTETGISCNVHERIESVDTVVESSRDVSSPASNDKRNSRKSVKKTINGGLHKLNKVISNFFNEYGQPYYDN